MTEEMKQEKFRILANTIAETEEREEPFAIQDKKGNISVIGDPDLTSMVKDDYTINFRFTKDHFDGNIPKDAEQKGNYIFITKIFKDKSITPQDDWRVMGAITDFNVFQKNLNKDGTVEMMDKDEMFAAFCRADQHVIKAIYTIVATFLQIDDETAMYMTPSTVTNACIQLMKNHPEVFNEADFFSI